MASTATPTAAPTWRCTWNRADARPVDGSGTRANAAACTGMNTKPMQRPRENISSRIHHGLVSSPTNRNMIVTSATPPVPIMASRRGPTSG